MPALGTIRFSWYCTTWSWRWTTLQAFSFTTLKWQPPYPIILLKSDTNLQPKARKKVNLKIYRYQHNRALNLVRVPRVCYFHTANNLIKPAYNYLFFCLQKQLDKPMASVTFPPFFFLLDNSRLAEQRRWMGFSPGSWPGADQRRETGRSGGRDQSAGMLTIVRGH